MKVIWLKCCTSVNLATVSDVQDRMIKTLVFHCSQFSHDLLYCAYSRAGWFPGRISVVYAIANLLDVDYLDGTNENIHVSCIRRFHPYKIGEKIVVSVEGEDDRQYFDGRIVDVHDDGELFDVEILEDEEILSNVPMSSISRP